LVLAATLAVLAAQVQFLELLARVEIKVAKMVETGVPVAVAVAALILTLAVLEVQVAQEEIMVLREVQTLVMQQAMVGQALVQI
jgi:hypothetical protein